MKRFLVLALMVLGTGLGTSFAGVTDIDLQFPTDPAVVDHVSWDFDYETETLTLFEDYFGDGSDMVEVTGTTDADPIIRIDKYLTNENAHTWVGFQMTLDPADDATFDYTVTPTSDMFTVIDTMDPYELVFLAPSPVEVGESVSFSFDILEPTVGQFNFDLQQTPIYIPEPATMCLLAFGGLALLKRRK
ncbi:MAG: PEP-CTERM sorting domain-containing protein [Planctomycetota bacterium]|jgi:hypothetical protein